MESNFRNALIIISAIVIAAIFLHGYWTIRKNKNPYKLKAKSEKIDPVERGFDGSGFDQDGVSRKRVVEDNPLDSSEIPTEPVPAPDFAEEPIPKDLDNNVLSGDILDNSIEPIISNLGDVDEMVSENDLELTPSDSEKIKTKVEAPVYQEPVTRAKPQVKKNVAKKPKVATKSSLKRNQMEIAFDEPSMDDMPSISAKDDVVKEPQATIEPEFIVLSVVMVDGQVMSGAALLPALLTLGLRYGDMNIFHRHEDAAGNGKVTFSLANMMNPGTFDLDQMETFTTQGVSLFMTLPNAGDPFEVFNLMLGAAKQLALEFKGQVLDDKRSVMTKQTEQHYMGKIREFERKNSIATG